MSRLQWSWYTVFLEYNIKEIQYVKGEKNALADALSRHPDPTSHPLDHLVPPFNMDIASFHGLTLSPGAASHPATDCHDLPTPRQLFDTGAIVQPVAPLDCPIWQTWDHTLIFFLTAILGYCSATLPGGKARQTNTKCVCQRLRGRKC
jgi:hypothetical protein